ncbi:outer membrane protein assembly factor BamE [Propionivibrio sp.]|uniref:outer membrane protein assembly factor BamE n=1 Tax=Propionivibrio sp. TaxID=2212460 RepID=UPI0025DC33D7|nr:outer membrane protein assembly factor BamE [Propionivibrio sp.]MBK7356232.1 outer membrane protein assembly factor BamE [Propionivibrio sp.]MBK8746226.1 outer membrane protein assembly factor BamE [Propionivibrio sp.]MBK8894462.1 outer membrane protein assembly factor BamE [Propionivibrio sp.]MBL0208385.1 outer membrane protein assembly factor BamE [Propionivibrio sp.]
MTLSRLAGTALLLAAIAGCSSVPRIVNEYKIDIQQGNVLTQDMVSQLRPGLTKDQVRFVLGSPVLMDMFHANRWDYVYRFQKGASGSVEMRKFSTYFDTNDKLVRVAGDVTAAQESDATAAPESRMREIDLGSIAADSTAPPPVEKGFFGRMMESVGF